MSPRRTLGRWGPASAMPLRYDRARCVTELCLKNEVVAKLSAGFVPAGVFELPTVSMQPQAVAAAAPVANVGNCVSPGMACLVRGPLS